MQWHKTVEIGELVRRGSMVVKQGARQLALFATGEGVFAVDNRCPHEGYPLCQGSVGEGAVLTCQWHNWKFDLASGLCLMGQDHVRSYPTRQQDGFVWVDLADASPEARRDRLLADLGEAFAKVQSGRMARELARLALGGFDPLEAIRLALARVHDRLEDGMTHAHAALADWLSRADAEGTDLESRLVCWNEALHHLAEDAYGEPEYPFPPALTEWDGVEFAAAVEREDETVAIAHVRGALAEGLPWADLEGAMAAVALSHYHDFGHSLIWVQKTAELLARLGPGVAESLLLPLVRSLVRATREDLIPEFKGYGPAVERAREHRAKASGERPFPGAPSRSARHAEVRRLAESSVNKALDWVVEGLAAGREPRDLWASLVEAAGIQLARFDLRFQERWDSPVGEDAGWLDLTHALTFADAVRVLADRHPGLWPEGLLQLACFVGRNRGIQDLALDPVGFVPADPGAFDRELAARVLDHGSAVPIFTAHLLKTATAVRSLVADLDPEAADAVRAGLARFVAGPLKARHARRMVHQALALVTRDHPGSGD